MPRRNSSNASVADQFTAIRWHDINEDLDDLYSNGSDRGRVYTAISGTALRVDIGAFAYVVGITYGTYAGSVDNVVTNSATNYIMINSSGTIVINTTGFVAAHARLATVVCAGGVVTSITIGKPDVFGGDLSGTNPLVTATSMSGNVTLANADDDYQQLDPNGANRNVTLGTTSVPEGRRFYIRNTGTSYALTVLQSSTLKAVIPSGFSALFVYDGTNWQLVIENLKEDYGTGADGDYTTAGNETLTGNKQYDNLTISNGDVLNTGGYWIKVRNKLTFGNSSSKIQLNGNNGSNGTAGSNSSGSSGAAGGAGGAGGAATASGSLPAGLAGPAGGNGGSAGNGSNPGTAGSAGGSPASTSETKGIGRTGSTGAAGGAGSGSGAPDGAGGTGGAGAAGGTSTMTSFDMFDYLTRLPIIDPAQTISVGGSGSSGGAGGGGGGGGAYFNGRGGGGGGGAGGSGSNGGNIWVAARIITGAGFFEAKGGNGGNGAAGGNGGPSGTPSGIGHGGGGGGGGTGGQGGTIVVISSDRTGFSGGATVTGGTAGTNGAGGTNDGVAGTTGVAGGTGKSLFIHR